MLINIPKWLFSVLYLRGPLRIHDYRITTIWVESPILTASYYKEYLGFELIFRNPMNRNSSILIKRKCNWISIKTIDSTIPINSQKITLNFHRIDKEYYQLC